MTNTTSYVSGLKDMNRDHIITCFAHEKCRAGGQEQEHAVWGCIINGEMGDKAGLSPSEKVEDERTDGQRARDPNESGARTRSDQIRIMSSRNKKRGDEGPGASQ